MANRISVKADFAQLGPREVEPKSQEQCWPSNFKSSSVKLTFDFYCTETVAELPSKCSLFFGSLGEMLFGEQTENPFRKWPLSGRGAELLFDVIATAFERNSIIVTTNLPFENWPEVLGNERLTGTALDRLTHRCHIIETKGESYRLKDAKRRSRAKQAAKEISA